VNQYNTSLKSLRLQFFTIAVMASRSGALLSQLTSLSVEEITFIVSDLEDVMSETASWHTFAQMLSRPQFGQFRTMRLHVLVADAKLNDTIMKTVKAKLVECNARDIIVTCSWSVYSFSLFTIFTQKIQGV
jgi:hypothetical protein